MKWRAWLSLSDALAAIIISREWSDHSFGSLWEVAECLGAHLDVCDANTDDTWTEQHAYLKDETINAVKAAIEQRRSEIDLLIQILDDLTDGGDPRAQETADGAS
jgi:hypothetical protein